NHTSIPILESGLGELTSLTRHNDGNFRNTPESRRVADRTVACGGRRSRSARHELARKVGGPPPTMKGQRPAARKIGRRRVSSPPTIIDDASDDYRRLASS